MALCAMLEAIEEITKKPIHDLFDMICGVSTGGILGCAVVFSHYSATEAKGLYLNLAEKIFGKKKWLNLLLSSEKGIYSSKQLTMAFQEQYDDNEPMLHPSYPDPMKKMFIIASELNEYGKYESVLFRNYVPKYLDRGATDFTNVTLVDALRATTAAPLYLDTVRINDSLFVDGGVVANNPAYHAILEAKELWGRDKEFTIVSLGTGTYKKIVKRVTSTSTIEESSVATEAELGGDIDASKTKPASITANLGRLLSVGTDSDRIVNDIQKMLRAYGDDNTKFFRFSPSGLGDMDLATSDLVAINKLYEDTKLYIEDNYRAFKLVGDELLQDPFSH